VPITGLSSIKVRVPVVDCKPGARLTVDNVDGVLNFASFNFWGISGAEIPQVLLLSVKSRSWHEAHRRYCF
jgi:hypothetical protein